ncbi:MAG TPA: NmrA family NAD(P)-binding protein [Saprospiraceae bacterium]|nr:NmrA family NAD(P)-binding protein [Saprospiraceae bacterium]
MAANDAKLAHIACRDIGKFTAMAFEEPEKSIGQKLNLLGDFMSGNELAAVASKLSNKIEYSHKLISIVLMWLFARAFIPLRRHIERWGQEPYPDEILRAVYQIKELRPETLDFKQYIKWKG